MKKIIFLLTCLLIMVSISGCLFREYFGFVSVSSDPSGALIYIDNQEVGVTEEGNPIKIKLKTGNHQLKIVLDGVKITKNITIQKDEVLPVTIFFSVIANITVDTGDAEIFYWQDKGDYPQGTSLGQITKATNFRFVEPGVYWFYAKKSGRVFTAKCITLSQNSEITNIALTSVTTTAARTDESTTIRGRTFLAPWEMEQYVKYKNPNNNIYVAKYYLYFGSLLNITGDWAYCQAIHETGFFKFGGDVKPEQNNYAGIGATGGGAGGASFNTPEEGVLAQLQHLWAYAVPSTEGEPAPIQKYPNKTGYWWNLDPRYKYVSKGCAPRWVNLNGKWAVPGETYAQMILNHRNNMLNFLGY